MRVVVVMVVLAMVVVGMWNGGAKGTGLRDFWMGTCAWVSMRCSERGE